MVGCRNIVLPMLYWVLINVAPSHRLEVIAAGQQRLFSPTDTPVSVVSPKSQVPATSSDIKSCLSSAMPSSFRVRFQKLKGKTATFTRTLLNQGFVTTYAAKIKTVNVTNIANCASLADAGGFVGFAFNGGTCNLFNMKSQSCGCETGGKDVIYVQDSYWPPKDRSGMLSLSLTHGLSSILAAWKWTPCDPAQPSTAAKFQLKWDNKIIALNKTTLNYTLGNTASLCTSNLSQVAALLKDVTLEAFDDADTLMSTVTVTLTNSTALAGKRYLLNSSNCLYYDATRGATFAALETFCITKLHSTMFIAYEAGDFSTYRKDLRFMMSYNPPIDVYYHYAGLRNTGDDWKFGNWSWLSGLPQSEDDQDVWQSIAYGSKCAEVLPDRRNHKLSATNCDDTSEAWVCHDYIR